MKRPYTELWNALENAGVLAHRTGEASQFKGCQVRIEIADEQNSGQGVIIYFNIDAKGNEVYVCQE